MRDGIDNSVRTEGQAASDIMSGVRETPTVRETGNGDLLSVLSDVHARLSAVESDNAGLRAEVEAAKNRGELGFNYEHAQHVLTKHFYHDHPQSEPEGPRVARFDAFTGQPIN